MRNRSSSNLVGKSSPNPTTSNLKRRNRRRSKQHFSLEESPLDTMADQRTMAELLRAPTEGYAEDVPNSRKKLKEVWSTICYEDEIFQDFLNTSESSNDETNVVNAPQKPFVFNHEPPMKILHKASTYRPHCLLRGGGDIVRRYLLSTMYLVELGEFNPIHNEDLDSTLKNDRFDTESYLLESLLNHDTLMASSPKIDSLLDEFTSELIKIPPIIVNREHEEYISLLERLLYDNSSPRPLENFHANPNTSIESLPAFPIPVEDSDSFREEIDIFCPFESFHVDYPDSGDSTIDVVEDIPVDVPNILPTHPTLHMDFDFIPSHNDHGSDLDVSSPSGDRNKIYDPGIFNEDKSTRFLATHSPVIDTLLPFSSKNKDKVFNHVLLLQRRNLLLLHHIRAL
ncbi:hypothetical protein Tco_1142579 [Tanacetum coccineum]